MSSRVGAPLALQPGFTGFFTVVEVDWRRRECTVALRDGEGNALGHTVVWLPPKKRAPRRWTESGRGWFPKSYCQEHPALPAADMARQAAEAFDGSINGPEYLIFPQGAPILRVDHPEQCESWAFGMLLDQAAAEARPTDRQAAARASRSHTQRSVRRAARRRRG